MTITTANPFRPTRWEHHQVGEALIWFTRTADQLSEPKSFYVYGSRGSGKTSLLRSICWEDLAFNSSLKMQRKLSDFNHLGIYIRFPDHVSASMDISQWGHAYDHSEQAEHAYHSFFSLAVELACVEKALEAAHSLRLEGLVCYQPSQELEIVEGIAKEFPQFGKIAGSEPKTFLDFARVCRRTIRLMNEACSRGSVADLLPYLPPREANQFLNLAIENLYNAIRIKSGNNEKRVVFKFCLDDCEVLSPTQKRSLNTLVRLSRSPVFWIVSSVDTVRFDSKTFISAQPLTDADRAVISLNDREDKAFKELCQAVVSLRLLSTASPAEQNRLGKTKPTDFFDLDGRLGVENVNSVIATMVRRSTKSDAKNIREAAEILQSLLKAPLGLQEEKADSQELPYYEAYILMHWRGREDSFDIDFDKANFGRITQHAANFEEPRFRAWLRRKQSAALYHIASRLKVRNVPLAGSNMIIGLSDRSIRDFLEIMGEIFEEYVRRQRLVPGSTDSLDKFARSGSKISAEVQSRGIQNASARYVAGVGYGEETEMDAMARLIRGLGHFVSNLQTNTADPRTLRTTERGIFFLQLSEGGIPEDEAVTVKKAIEQAELSGYIRAESIPHHMKSKLQSGDADAMTFRLHRRFAPYFNFSYRGPYEVVRISPKSIASLIYGHNDETPYRWAEGLVQGWNRDVEQIDLPLKSLEKE